MPQQDIELILIRQWASYLTLPVFLADTNGNLLFYNEPAEHVLNQRYDETGDMPASVWGKEFAVEDEHRQPIPFDEWPLVVAYTRKKAISRIVWLQCRDHAWRNVSFTAFPIMGQAGLFLGALSIFWEV